MSITVDDVKSALSKVIDPNTNKDFVSSKSIRNLKVESGEISLDIELGYPAKSQIELLRANVLAALQAEGRVLTGLEIVFQHRPYDWNHPAPLEKLAGELTASGAVIAASSEGGLFEYGSDDAIVGNLQALHAGGVRLVAGSVTKDDEARRRMIANSKFKLVPRGLHGIAPLAERGGYAIAEVAPSHFSDQVALRPR